ncbi:unnamed protein product [Pseudo-nitzschia multistriata]|uniref:Cleft lip and palate transmembrane protein 1-like protein n=1 Tax=Pseudo-nitzschia multistriata TaxID=183589 RepID=A0A448ZRA1_9STRA|nr:unnamed protein product [Pseudo-nitzschia multistriata]
MWFLWIIILVAYGTLTWQSLLEASAPAVPCFDEGNGDDSSNPNSWRCYRPAVRVGESLTLQLELFSSPSGSGAAGGTIPRWTPVETCRIDLAVPPVGKLPGLVTDSKKGSGIGSSSDGSAMPSNGSDNTNEYRDEKSSTKPQEGNQRCEVIFSKEARHRSSIQSEVQPLKARFVVLAPLGGDNNGRVKIETMAPFFLTRVEKRDPNSIMRLLMSNPNPGAPDKDSGTQVETCRSDSTESNNCTIGSNTGDNDSNKIMWIPFVKFGRAPVRIRFVAEERGYAFLQRADGIRLKALNSTTYTPLLYVDELSLQRGAQIELAPFEANKPAFELQIKLGSISPMVDTLYRQVQDAFETIEGSFFQGSELDELRYFLQDENLYRFALTNIISTLHVWLDYLAFRDEVRFYRGKQNLSGVSPSTAVTKMICSMIILLYLIDGGGTSWIVLFSLILSFVVDAWKVLKLLRPTPTRSFPFVKIREFASKQEEEIAEYDRIACRRLSMLIYPVVVCWSIYALKNYEYRSLYSWFISNAANGVYTFGFISMCPQLYVNYRLKSVAHLPWKVFLYKIFSTFVDDAFAWLIEMPLKHRLMTLRDDVVFLCFLGQVYMYRVDKTRSNEFGYSYGEDEDDTSQELNTTEGTDKASPSDSTRKHRNEVPSSSKLKDE